MRRYIAVIAALIAIAGVTSYALVMNVSAETPPASERESIVLSPVTQHFDAKPGAVMSSEITAVNDGTVDERIVLYSRPYSVTNEAYDPDYTSTSSITDAYQWVQLTKTEYTIAAGETIKIPYGLQIPKTAAPGGHYGVIFIETQPKTGSSDSVIRKKRIGTILLVNVAGAVNKSGSVVSSDVPFWQQQAPMQTATRVQNDGNIDFQTSTTLTVKDLFGSIKHSQKKDFIVFPGTTRNITMSWDDAAWFGLFKVDQSTTVLGKTTDVSNLVLIAPRWLPYTLLVVLVIGVGYAIRRRRQQ